jgi:hypothetical protein
MRGTRAQAALRSQVHARNTGPSSSAFHSPCAEHGPKQLCVPKSMRGTRPVGPWLPPVAPGSRGRRVLLLVVREVLPSRRSSSVAKPPREQAQGLSVFHVEHQPRTRPSQGEAGARCSTWNISSALRRGRGQTRVTRVPVEHQLGTRRGRGQTRITVFRWNISSAALASENISLALVHLRRAVFHVEHQVGTRRGRGQTRVTVFRWNISSAALHPRSDRAALSTRETSARHRAPSGVRRALMFHVEHQPRHRAIPQVGGR